MDAPIRVLFVCTANACRSPMAEAILRHASPQAFEAFSAGSRPAGFIHPLALQTLERLNISTEGLQSQYVGEFVGVPMDVCLTLCDNASAECPSWKSGTAQAHWGLPDPVFYEGSEDERLQFCEQVAKRLMKKITRLINVPVRSMSPEELAEELQRLAAL